jgi:ABC-type bacteriocin/lantibiotic exporter with double-glycine peptidase domain
MKPGCGARCLAMACERLGVKVAAEEIAGLAGEENGQVSLAGLARAGRALGFRATAEVWTVTELLEHGPALAGRTVLHFADPGHFLLLTSVSGEAVTVADPTGLKMAKTRFSAQELSAAWSGKLLVLRGAPGGKGL